MTRFVLTWLSTAAGGAERSVGELAGALAAAGHQVTLVWWDATATDGSRPADQRVTVYRVANLSGYRAAVRTAMGSGGGSVMIGTHRTMLVDVAMAQHYIMTYRSSWLCGRCCWPRVGCGFWMRQADNSKRVLRTN